MLQFAGSEYVFQLAAATSSMMSQCTPCSRLNLLAFPCHGACSKILHHIWIEKQWNLFLYPLPLTPHPSRLSRATSPPDNPDVPVPPLAKSSIRLVPNSIALSPATGHPATPSSNPMSQRQSAPSQSHDRHHDCNSGTPARHTSRLPASALRSDRREMAPGGKGASRRRGLAGENSARNSNPCSLGA